MFLSAAVGTALMPLYLWTFIIRLQWGIQGAAMAFSAAVISIALVNILVVVWRETSLKRADAQERCFHGWTWAAFSKIRGYLQYALPSYFMCVCGWHHGVGRCLCVCVLKYYVHISPLCPQKPDECAPT